MSVELRETVVIHTPGHADVFVRRGENGTIQLWNGVPVAPRIYVTATDLRKALEVLEVELDGPSDEGPRPERTRSTRR